MDGEPDKPYIPQGSFLPHYTIKTSLSEIIKKSLISNDQMTPESEQEPQPFFDRETFEIQVVEPNDQASYTAGRAYYNKEANKLLVCLHPYQYGFKLSEEAFERGLSRGATTFTVDSIGVYEIDEDKLPVCKFFVASKSVKESELPADWKFNTAFTHSSCVCPEMGASLKKPGKCNYNPVFNRCNGFEALDPINVANIVDESGHIVGSITKSYARDRIPRYTSNLTDQNFSDIPSLTEMLADNLEVKPTEPVSNKVSYFSTVFVQDGPAS